MAGHRRPLSLRLPGNAITNGYLTVQGHRELSGRDQAVLLALVPGLAAQLRSYLPLTLAGELTPRARQVAELVALGFTNAEIAATLSVREDSVKKSLQRAMRKLGIERRTQLAVSWTTGRILALPAVQR